jgi:hypothetical protein
MESQVETRGIKQRFRVGRLYATPGALALAERERLDLTAYFERHMAGDWGDMSKEDRQANEDALTDESRIFSAYSLPGGERLWIITEADRRATTLLLPEEY